MPSITSFIHSFILDMSIAPLQVHYYSEALPTQRGYCAGVSCRSATGNCELRTCPRSIGGSYSGMRTCDPPVERYRLNQCAITSLKCDFCHIIISPCAIIPHISPYLASIHSLCSLPYFINSLHYC